MLKIFYITVNVELEAQSYNLNLGPKTLVKTLPLVLMIQIMAVTLENNLSRFPTLAPTFFAKFAIMLL